MRVLSLIRENKYFFVLHTLLFVGGSYPLLAFDKVVLLLKLNSFHHLFLDYFFYYATFLGSSIAYALLMAVLVVMKLDNRALLAGLSSFIFMSIIVQGMKRLVFFDHLRPIALIPVDTPLHLVEGIVFDTHLSFPSGHAATIFVAVCFIHLLMPKKLIGYSVFLLLGAVIVAYSRVYLCQHFYGDIYVGALLGTWTTTVVYGMLLHWKGPAWLDQKLYVMLFGKGKKETSGLS